MYLFASKFKTTTYNEELTLFSHFDNCADVSSAGNSAAFQTAKILLNTGTSAANLGLINFTVIDVCDVTLSAYPHRAGLKNMPGHGGNRTYDLWNTSPMLFQLNYAVRSVRVSDISEQNLVPSISM